MKHTIFGSIAALLGLMLCSLWQALYQIAFGIPADMLFPNAFTRFYVQGGYQTLVQQALCCLVAVMACFAAARSLSKRWVIFAATISIGFWIVVRLRNLTPLPLARNGGTPPWPEYVLYGAALIGFHFAAGWLSGRLWRIGWQDDLTTAAAKPQGVRAGSSRGFTTVELMTALAIVAILFGLSFPLVASAKRSAHYAEDLNSLRQTYAAICLYENDHDRSSPTSLTQLVPEYVPAKVLGSHTDTRPSAGHSNWPANVWVDIPQTDKEYAELRSPFPVSYSYLRPYSYRFPKGVTFTEYREDPKIGLLVDPAVGQCRKPEFTDDASCMFFGDQPATNIDRWLVIRTDGSAVARNIPSCHSGGYSYEQQFLFLDLCGIARGGRE